VNIDILLYDGFDELDGIGPYEVFDYALGYAAERASDGADDGGTDVTERPGRVRYVTLDEREWVTASHGTRVGVDGVLPGPNADEASDLLVVPGGGWTARDEGRERVGGGTEGRDAARARRVPRRRCSDRGGLYRCDAARGGRRHRRAARGHPASAIDELRESGAAVVDTRVVDDGDLLTAGGVTSGIDLALYLVEQEFGEEIADRVATVIEYERRYEVAGGEVRSEE